MRSEEHFDLIIASTIESHHVHKALVCPRSRVLASKVQLAQTTSGIDSIDLDVEDPDLVARLVSYFYNAEYEPFLLPDPTDALPSFEGTTVTQYQYDFPHTCAGDQRCRKPNVCPHHVCGGDTCNHSCNGKTCRECELNVAPSDPASAFAVNQLMTHVKMFVLGGKYQVDGLQDLAVAKFRQAAERFFTSTEFEQLAEEIVMRDDDLIKPLRRMIVETIAGRRELFGKGKIKLMLESKAGFALEVLMASDAGRRVS